MSTETQAQKCERCLADGLEHGEYCKYYGEPNGCNSPTYGEYPSTVSDTAKMRQALICIDNIISHIEVGNIRDILHAYKNIHDRIRIALAAPPRNCDIGTAEEQDKRNREFCKGRPCYGCPANKSGIRCSFVWEQMPYEGGENNV